MTYRKLKWQKGQAAEARRSPDRIGHTKWTEWPWMPVTVVKTGRDYMGQFVLVRFDGDHEVRKLHPDLVRVAAPEVEP